MSDRLLRVMDLLLRANPEDLKIRLISVRAVRGGSLDPTAAIVTPSVYSVGRSYSLSVFICLSSSTTWPLLA